MQQTGSRDAEFAPQRRLQPPSFHNLWGLTRHAAIGGIAGVVTGLLVGGVGGRLFMRAAGAAAREAAQGATTEAGFSVGEITLGGTLSFIIFVGIFSGAAGAFLYLIFRPWLARAGRWRGVTFGILLFAATSATSDMLNPDNRDFTILRNEVFLVTLIVVMFIGFGVTIDLLFSVLDRHLPPGEVRYDPARFLYASLTGLGLLLVGPMPFALFAENSCSCDPPRVASAFVVLAALGTALWWLSGLLTQRSRELAVVGSVLGYVGVGGVLAFGLIRAISDVVEIVT